MESERRTVGAVGTGRSAEYVGIDPDKPAERMTMLFVPLEGGHYALQFSSTKEPNTAYAIAEIAGHERHTRYWRDWSSDVCSSDLASITYNHDNCRIAPSGNARDLMSKLAGLLPEADIKLAPLP